MPDSPRRSLRALSAALVALSALVGLAMTRQLLGNRTLPPLEVSFWYWHQPLRLSEDEAEELRAMHVNTFYARAGSFRRDGEGVRMVLPQVWDPAPKRPPRLHAVFNFDGDVVRGFAQMNNARIARTVQQAYEHARKNARAAGWNVAGLQLDLDCPTRLLPKYADLMRALRDLLPNDNKQETVLSITALPTWFTSNQLAGLVQSVDFYVPQYYEGRIPRTLNDYVPVSQRNTIERGLHAAARLGTSFHVGLPAYGHSLIYEKSGRLIGNFRDLSLLDAMRHPALRLIKSHPLDQDGSAATRATYIGEDFFLFAARTSSIDGGGEYRVVYDVPTPAILRQHLDTVRLQRPRNLAGVILFRYPEPEERGVLPVQSVRAVLHGEEALPRLHVDVTTESDPWELIETGRTARRVAMSLTVKATNTGAANTYLAEDAVVVSMIFDRPGLEEIDPGGFDAVETFFVDPSPPVAKGTGELTVLSGLRTSVRRANAVVLRRFHLRAGETVPAASIHTTADGPSRVTTLWMLRGPGGFTRYKGAKVDTPLEVRS